ncbi:MAG: hypothetical protein ACRDC6_23240 [Shewanella sp.]
MALSEPQYGFQFWLERNAPQLQSLLNWDDRCVDVDEVETSCGERGGSVGRPSCRVFVGGYRVQINGQSVAIAGTSLCRSHKSRHDCIVVTPDTSVVEVLVVYLGQSLREAWTVKRVGEQRQLLRGDGSTVMVAN